MEGQEVLLLGEDYRYCDPCKDGSDYRRDHRKHHDPCDEIESCKSAIHAIHVVTEMTIGTGEAGYRSCSLSSYSAEALAGSEAAETIVSTAMTAEEVGYLF